MKKVIVFALLTIAIFSQGFSQVSKIEYKVVQLVTEQEFYLNSATRLGGKTRAYIKIQIPNNAVEWYYYIATERNPGNPQTLQLASKLTSLVDKTGITETLIQNTFSSTGSDVIDVYLLDNNNITPFLNKDVGSKCIANSI